MLASSDLGSNVLVVVLLCSPEMIQLLHFDCRQGLSDAGSVPLFPVTFGAFSTEGEDKYPLSVINCLNFRMR